MYTLQPSLSWGDGARLQREVIAGESFILAEMVEVDFAPDPLPFAKVGVAAWDHPLYVVAGHLLVRSIPSADSLWLVNLISAVGGALTIALVYRLVHRHTASSAAALIGALSLAVSHTFWFHAVTPEVYTLFVFLVLLSLALYDRCETQRRLATLAGSLFVLGLAASVHLLAFLALPAIALYLLRSRRWGVFAALKARDLLLLTLSFSAGFSIYLIQLVRMLRTFSLWAVSGPAVGATFLRGAVASSPAEIGASILTYALFLNLQFSPVGVVAGVFGLRSMLPTSAALRDKAAAFFGIYLLFGLLYRVADQFAFFLTSYVFWAILIGCGVAELERRLPVVSRRVLLGGLAFTIVAMPLFYGALPDIAKAAGITDQNLGIPQIGSGYRDGLRFYGNPNKRGDYSARQFGTETLAGLPRDAVVIAEWYTDTDEYFVLRYFSTIEQQRPDVEVVGWPVVDPANFDSQQAVQKIEAEIQRSRPVYLASLSERYYQASTLLKRYCVVSQANLYRVYPGNPADLLAAGWPCIRRDHISP